ncbi:right-handed parallel beta-helix repeat-containing protein [Chitinophaga pinensis]|uniref:Parallel beta-helix repeat protein n=1 Tax=Chitinophaga pinensis (strain ATCC 43595 / DSM 2588 / LMG 13176 / NBRC 15968 / NCIMB 11800 / UQM 2034) TaxID=485918 RepID=A0A979G7F5_CHIPD|nr:right-handed parallel beta-helix repeat-containing protein [Chitinophaga pinensis]ACU62190.1 hypothetical protein Cpin_4755 [Chitinophaga pinensis DSM 2588]
MTIRILQVAFWLFFSLVCASDASKVYALSVYKPVAIDVRALGAKGDGTTDDSKAIQQALNQAATASDKIVSFPAGQYLISQTLRTAAAGTRMVFAKGASLKLANNTNGGILILNDNCSVENATLQGNGQSAPDLYKGYGIALSAVSNSTVKNCIFTGISGFNIFLNRNGNKGCNKCVITGNTIKSPALSLPKGYDGSGIMIGYSGTGYAHTDNEVSNNTIDGAQTLGHGIAVMTHGSGNKIIGNTISNCLRYGIISYETSYEDSTLFTTAIINNTVSNIGAKDGTTNNMGMGIYVMKTHGAIVKGNKVSNTLINSDNTETLGRGAITVSGGVGCTVENNTITNSGRYGIVCIYGFNTSIRNNKILGVKESGIYMRNTNGNVIEGNEFRDIAKLAIRGQFGNTGRPAYSSNGFLKRFRNIPTGENIRIANNKFYGTSTNVINLVGEDDKTSQGYNNQLKDLDIQDNQLIGNKNTIDNSIKVSNVAPGGSRIMRNRNN